jgi:hypothetical protein
LSLFIFVASFVEAAIADRGYRAFGHHGAGPPAAGRDEAGRHTAATIDNFDFIDGAKRGVGRLAGAQRPKAARLASSAGRAPKWSVGSVNPSSVTSLHPFRT